jgi:pilus assembly protein Flp/PilA
MDRRCLAKGLRQRESAQNGFRSDEDIPMKSFGEFLTDVSGATAVEYALICSLISIFVVVALRSLGTNISSEFSEVGNTMK